MSGKLRHHAVKSVALYLEVSSYDVRKSANEIRDVLGYDPMKRHERR